ncbi:hypothetical protein J5N97_018834 [Dioscorea zingiberensis]|uniref:WRKY domain-containing protein n=1 Tax=Dioscorea zingiberensis TaxID=325984 RepID=A0A9D5HC37_9LILI|nr:hypothetical protein J5N97_018834 [Dioscorea zingiberensis]
MENNDQGDLADIVRASGRGGGTDIDIPGMMPADWQFIPSQPVSFPLPTDLGRREEDLGDAFGSIRDPLLHELTVSSLMFDHGQDPKIALEETRTSRPCDVFSRVLQISPGVSKPCQISRSPAGCPQDHLADIQISSPRITPGIKRRKSQAKKVVCIPAPAAANSRSSGEVVPSDLWAWRKYGQKPIKGSPYPRGYYRCSSSKGCSARKQVERSRTDPNMLVITYTSEHNHPWPTQRNALAGSTRSQPSKNMNSSAQKINQMKPATSMKEEPKDTTSSSSTTPVVKEEGGELADKAMEASDDQELDQMFHESYKPMMPESNHPDDFFADLAELEPDPMNLIFSKGGLLGDKLDEERESNKAIMDPFNIFDWGLMNSFGETKRGL